MLFIICETTGIVSANAKSKETDVVTRAEWLSDLVDTFEMTVEDDNYPDNYFSDLESSSEYYQKILVAVQFGVVNVEAGDPIYPNDPTTREFAASTLNFCLGYQMEKQDTTYTFSDSADVTDKDSAQIAVNHGWFTLIGGKFCPQNKVTSDEVTHMLADAKTIWNSTDVDRNYDSKYTLANGVIEIPEGTDTYLLDDGRVYIAECPKEISVGDSFAVHLNGIPCVYKAEKIEKDNSDYIITVSELSHDEAYKEADMQGTVDASALQIGEAADGLKVDYSEEKGNTVSRRKARGSVNLDKYTSLKVSGKIKVVDQSVSLDVKMKNVKIDYAISLTGETFVKLRGDSDVTCKCDFDAGKSMGLGEVPLLPAQIPGVGGIDLIMEVSFGGKFNYKTSGYLVTGLSYSKANGFRIIKNFNAKSFTVTCEANVSAGLKVRMGVTGSALPIKGYVYTTVGGKAVFRYASYNDGLPKGCTTVVAYVYASTGAEASIKLLGVDASISKETELYGEDNSPIRVYHHYEDGKEVIKCSRGNDFKYYTNINSRYWGNGWTEGIGDYGYDENGNKVPLYTYTLDEENNATITGYKGRAAYLHIPETVDGYTVVGIGSEAFRGNRTILSVDFPDSVIKIESYAFAETGLTELELPKNLQIMREHILQGNTGVKELTIPKTVTEMHTDRGTYFPKYGALEESGIETVVFEDGITKIPYMAVRNTKKLTKVVIPETVTQIESNAMEYCASLEKVELPENLTEIGSYAFSETGLKELKLPKNLRIMREHILQGNTGVKELTIPKTVTEMHTDRGAYFPKYGALEESGIETVVFEDGITKIPYMAVRNTKNLTKVVIPETVTQIESNAMEYCASLEKVELPENLTEIGSYAFSETGLKELKLPKNLRIMREHILQGNTGVKELTIPKTVTEMHTDRGAYFPKYGALEESGVETVVFEDGIAKIPYMAVRNAKNLTKIVISETVVKIESNAMEYCASLEKVDLPENVTEIGSCAFAETGLKQIILPNSIETLGIYTFRGCTSLTSITLSNKIEYIAARMFENCTSLETITLPDTVITINDNAFNGCTSLKNIEWGKSLKYINEYAFTNCTSLTNIKIPDTVEKIENGTFCNNSSLEKIELSKSLTWIGYRTFYNCDALTSIEIPDSVTDLGDQIFYDCDALTDVKLGTGIKKIPDSTFEHCDKLASIVLPYRVESIGNNVFKNDVALTEITIPRATTTIGSSVFSYLDKMTIYGVPGTYAETYAKENGIKFVSKEVKATKVTLDKNELTLNNGTRYTLKLSVEPEDFTDEVTWKSTNTDVATIDSDGVINARATGNAMIKVMVGEQNVTCNVKVVQPVISISLNRENLSLDALETHQLVPNIYPGNAENQNIEWKSEDETIATVSDAGLVKAVKEGTTTITATAKDGSGVTAKCTVTVKNTAYVVKNVEELESPHNYKNNCSDFWMYTMENESFLNVTFDSRTEIEDSFDYIYIYNADGTEVGKYTGKELSGATVKVTGDTVKIKLVSDGAGNAWGFKVSDIAGTSAKLPQSISVNEHINKRFNDAQFNLDAVSTVGDGVLSYRSEDTEVASVDNSGNVTIKGVGTVYIIITAAETDEYKETRKTVELVVDKAQQNPEIICNTDTIIEGQQIQIVTNNSIGDVVYESENTQIASINDTGLITGIAAGDVGINIIVEGNQYYESWTKRIILHVVKKQENIVLLTECEIKLSDTAYVYDGGEIRPEVTVSYNRTILTEGVDYILSYENNIDPGTATVTIEAAENSGYIGTVQKNFAIRAVLDEYVTVVQPGAFKGCANLTNVNIRSTVTGIGEQAFADCKNLRNIYFYGNCPETGKDMFQNVTANAYYPYNDLTWSMDKLQDYGGNITWCPWNPQTGEPARRDLSICEMTVSAKDLTYNGKAQTPQITVTDSGKVLQEGVDYTVTYENNVKAGTATVTATGAGIYGGSITTRFAISKASNTIKVSDITKTASSKSQTVKTTVRAYGGAKLTYSSNNKSVKVDKTGKLTIAKNFAGKAVITVKSSETSCYKAASKKVNVTVKPAAVTISKASNSAKQKITVSWKKNTTCSGYAVQYSTDKSFKKGVKTVYISKNSTVKATLSKLTKGKTYYVRIASYKKSGSTKIYSAWSKVKSVKVKK